jgi:hypothetical protein
LTDFGCEHSFARAAQSFREHYGFEIGASAVRQTTLEQAQRAQAELEAKYEQPFRVLPVQGAEHVIAQADGSMICTVEPGPRQGKRPRKYEEIRLVAAQAKDSATTGRCKIASVNCLALFCPAPFGGRRSEGERSEPSAAAPRRGLARENWSRAGRDGFLLRCRQTLNYENQNDPPNAS